MILRANDLVETVASALQYIRYYHPADYISHLAHAYEVEQGEAARDAIAQILTNSRMCAEGRRPICQDTGIVNVFLKIGMDVRFEGFAGSIEDAVNEGVRRGYLDPDNTLRASVLSDPIFERRNTKDNTPAVVHMTVVPGDTVVWVNRDIVPHTVTADARQFDSGSMGPSAEWSLVVRERGRISYTCTFHPTMKGLLVVK